jgi:hypothetical protein
MTQVDAFIYLQCLSQQKYSGSAVEVVRKAKFEDEDEVPD